MNKLFSLSVIIILIFYAGTAHAQVKRIDTLVYESEKEMKVTDHLMIGMGNDIWLDAPANVDIRGYNPSFVMSAMFDSRFGESRITFGAGLGLQSNNLYSNSFLVENNMNGKRAFAPIPDSIDYSKNKINVTYLELPVELRLRMGAEYDYTFAIGFKVGYLIGSHIKFKGEDYLGGNSISSDNKVKIKEHNISDLTKLRYTATARFAYKRISVFAHYNLVPLFEENELVNQQTGETTDMYLVTAGLMLSLF